MDCQAVLFDLDGTLLDTVDDIAASANRVLTTRGFAPHPRESYQWFMGDGAQALMTRALPENARTEEQIQACVQAYLADYTQNWHQATRPYKGIPELLDVLQERKVMLAVVSNKPHRYTGLMVHHYFRRIPFLSIAGQQAGIPKKPHPDMALAAAEILAVPPGRCIFLGDSAVDMQTGRRAGMTPIGAGWGYRPAEELLQAGAMQVIHNPLELAAILDA